MRAVVRREGALVCDDIADLTPGPGQTLVKTLCCGICGSDLHALHSWEHMVELSRRAGGLEGVDASKDLVFGHEFSAEILDHGPGAPHRLKPGTRVVSMPVVFGADGSMEALGYSDRLPGGFAERMVLNEMLLLEVPNGLSAAQAALTEPFSVGAHAVAESAVDKDCASLVVGCGPVGLAVIAALKAKGLGPVMAADFSPARRAMAERMGADIVVDPAEESPHRRWSALGVPATGLERRMATMAGETGKRAVIFECVGVPGMIQALIESAPPSAQILVVGVCMQPDRFEPFLAITKQLDIRFVYAYTPEEFAGTLRAIAEGLIDVTPVITDTVGLDGVADAFHRLADPERQVKIMVDPSL